MPDFLPKPEFELRSFAKPFSDTIAAEHEVYGVSSEQADVLVVAYDAFAQLLSLSHDPVSRTSNIILQKDQAKALLKAQLRIVAAIVRANPAVNIEQRQALGLRPRASATRISPPESRPNVIIESVNGRKVTIRLTDSDSSTHGKPRGVVAAQIFSHVAPVAPGKHTEWTTHAQTSRTKLTISFPDEIPGGSMVWITARWLNPRMQAGECALPINTWLAGGSALPIVNQLAA